MLAREFTGSQLRFGGRGDSRCVHRQPHGLDFPAQVASEYNHLSRSII